MALCSIHSVHCFKHSCVYLVCFTSCLQNFSEIKNQNASTCYYSDYLPWQKCNVVANPHAWSISWGLTIVEKWLNKPAGTTRDQGAFETGLLLILAYGGEIRELQKDTNDKQTVKWFKYDSLKTTIYMLVRCISKRLKLKKKKNTYRELKWLHREGWLLKVNSKQSQRNTK